MKLKQVLPKNLLKALLKIGFRIDRQKGSHVFLERRQNSQIFRTSISIKNYPLDKRVTEKFTYKSGVKLMCEYAHPSEILDAVNQVLKESEDGF